MQSYYFFFGAGLGSGFFGAGFPAGALPPFGDFAGSLTLAMMSSSKDQLRSCVS